MFLLFFCRKLISHSNFATPGTFVRVGLNVIFCQCASFPSYFHETANFPSVRSELIFDARQESNSLGTRQWLYASTITYPRDKIAQWLRALTLRKNITFSCRRRKSSKVRIIYNAIGISTFNCTRTAILLCGDVHPQPGPATNQPIGQKKDATPRCSQCEKPVQRNLHKKVLCEKCFDASHAWCTNICYTKNIQVSQPANWVCDNCTLLELPFHNVKVWVHFEEPNEFSQLPFKYCLCHRGS